MPDLRKFCHSFLFLRIFPSEISWPLYPLPCQHWFESSKYGSYSKPMVKIQSNNQQKIHYFDTKMRWRLYGILCSRILWEKGISKSKFDILNKNDWIWKITLLVNFLNDYIHLFSKISIFKLNIWKISSWIFFFETLSNFESSWTDICGKIFFVWLVLYLFCSIDHSKEELYKCFSIVVHV